MTINFTFIKISLLFFLCSTNVIAQQLSVFDANYFVKDGQAPPIEVGKGFRINDVFGQTKYCFTTESSAQNKLKLKGTGSTTKVSVHYIKDEEAYNYFKTKGVSGKVSYLNLFSGGGNHLEEFNTSNSEDAERLIFFAKVDFGYFSFEHDPVLLPEPKALINESKFDEFINLYGTHFISGVRKESNIIVTLTKTSSNTTSSESNENELSGGANFPIKVGLNFEVKNSDALENMMKSSHYNISVEMNGPKLEKSQIISSITDILKDDTDNNKINSISSLLQKSIDAISNPAQSIVSQYYYSPFSLYKLKNVNWDELKQNNLIKINENVLKIYSTKSGLEEYINPNTLSELINAYNEAFPTFNKRGVYVDEIKQTYNKSLPKIKSYKLQFDSCLSVLRGAYNSCSDINCVSTDNCCSQGNIDEFLNTLIYKSDLETNKLETTFEKACNVAQTDADMPPCEKNKKGYIIIVNKSSNPYDIYQGDAFIETLKGGYQKKFMVNKGTYTFKAQQQSGFLMYPTINNRTAVVSSYCEEVILKIGFED